MAFYMEHGKQQFQWTNRQTVSQNGDIMIILVQKLSVNSKLGEFMVRRFILKLGVPQIYYYVIAIETVTVHQSIYNWYVEYIRVNIVI